MCMYKYIVEVLSPVGMSFDSYHNNKEYENGKNDKRLQITKHYDFILFLYLWKNS
jgi:hypothetical protein